MITYKQGDLLKAKDVDFICHQVNCHGVMRSGIANQIRERYPEVYETYRAKVLATQDKKGLLGTIQVIPVKGGPHKGIINMFAQYDYGSDHMRYTSYDAFQNCLHELAERFPPHIVLGFPKYIGCGLGGADWRIISVMLENTLVGNTAIIYSLDGDTKPESEVIEV